MNEHDNHDYPEPYLSNQRKEKKIMEENNIIQSNNATTKEVWIEHFMKNHNCDYLEAERLAEQRMAELEEEYGRNQI